MYVRFHFLQLEHYLDLEPTLAMSSFASDIKDNDSISDSVAIIAVTDSSFSFVLTVSGTLLL